MILYVNDEGPISTVSQCPQRNACREVSDNDPELVAFIERADRIMYGAKTIEQKVDEQINSPLAQAMIKAFATPEYESKIREGLKEYFSKIDTDTPQTLQK